MNHCAGCTMGGALCLYSLNCRGGFNSVRGRILPFSYLPAVAVNTVLAGAGAQPVIIVSFVYPCSGSLYGKIAIDSILQQHFYRVVILYM